MLDLTAKLSKLDASPRGFGRLARSLPGSRILKIAYEVRARAERGDDVLNLTVGDFDSAEFPIPEGLALEIQRAIADGQTNYPPSTGIAPLRQAVRELFASRLALGYPEESILIAGGARPLIAGLYLSILDPGDHVVYGTPSWNNHHYCALVGAVPIEVPTTAGERFFPSSEAILKHLGVARLVVLNSPQNPSGTVISAEALRTIARAVVDENLRRRSVGRPPVYLMYDQVYWLLTFEGARHETPVGLVPEVAPYTLFVDGISKGFAATGLRVGWGVGPPDVIERMNALGTHLGSWAPKPEQVATARFLADRAAMDTYVAQLSAGVHARLRALSEAIMTLKHEGLPVDAIEPQGAIYLSMRLDLRGRRTDQDQVLSSDEEVRRYLLDRAGIAVVPFGCFGARDDTGWFRASVGAVSRDACATFEDRLRGALQALRPRAAG